MEKKSTMRNGTITAEDYMEANGIERPGESYRDIDDTPAPLVNCSSCGKKLVHDKSGWKFCGNRNCKLYLNINEILSPSPGVLSASTKRR